MTMPLKIASGRQQKNRSSGTTCSAITVSKTSRHRHTWLNAELFSTSPLLIKWGAGGSRIAVGRGMISYTGSVGEPANEPRGSAGRRLSS